MTGNIDLARLLDLHARNRPQTALICSAVVAVLVPIILAAGVLAVVASAILAIFRAGQRTRRPDRTPVLAPIGPLGTATSTTAS